MEKYDADKLYKILKWTQRVMILEKVTGKDINEMLGYYADQHLDCRKCPLYSECQHRSVNCNDFWRDYLEGKF